MESDIKQYPGGNSRHELSKDKAHDFIKKFKDRKLKKGELAFTRFDPNVLRFVFCEDADKDNISEVKFYCGGYEKIYGKDKDLIPVIIMQVQYRTQGLRSMYKYFSGEAAICPPPYEPPCNDQIEDQGE